MRLDVSFLFSLAESFSIVRMPGTHVNLLFSSSFFFGSRNQTRSFFGGVGLKGGRSEVAAQHISWLMVLGCIINDLSSYFRSCSIFVPHISSLLDLICVSCTVLYCTATVGTTTIMHVVLVAVIAIHPYHIH